MTEHLTTVFEGELEKKGGGTWSSSFRKRWCQLQCGRTQKRLVYFKGDPATHEARGFIDLSINNVITIETNEPDKQIIIYTHKRTWVLRAKTIREIQLWSRWMLTPSEEAQLQSIRFTARGKSAFLGSSMTNLFSGTVEDNEEVAAARCSFSDDAMSLTMSMDQSESGVSESLNVSAMSLSDPEKENSMDSFSISELHSADTLRRRLTEFNVEKEYNCYE